MFEKILTGFIFPTVVGIVTYAVIEKIQKKKKRDLEEHYIFSRLESIKEINIDLNLNISNKGKEVVFKCILRNQVDCIIEECKKIASNVDNHEGKYMTQGVLQEELLSGLDNIFIQLYSFYLLDFGYTQEDKKTLDAVMDKYKKLNKERINRIYAGVYVVDSSIFYDSPKQKVSAFYDLLIGLVLDELVNSELTLNSINGDLKGLKFKGVEI